MSDTWPSREPFQTEIIVDVTAIEQETNRASNITLGIIGIGLEALGAVEVVEGNGRDLAAVAFGLFIIGIGYLSDNGGAKANFGNVKQWVTDKLTYEAEPAGTEVEQIDSSPVIV